MNNRMKRMKNAEEHKKTFQETMDMESRMSFDEFNNYDEKRRKDFIKKFDLNPVQDTLIDYIDILAMSNKVRNRFNPVLGYGVDDKLDLIRVAQNVRDDQLYKLKDRVEQNDVLIPELYFTPEEYEVGLNMIQQLGNFSDESIQNVRVKVQNNEKGYGVFLPRLDRHNVPVFADAFCFYVYCEKKVLVCTIIDSKKSINQIHKYWDKYLPNVKRNVISGLQGVDHRDPDFTNPVFSKTIDAVKSLSHSQMKKIAKGMNKFTVKTMNYITKELDEDDLQSASDILDDFLKRNENQNFENN